MTAENFERLQRGDVYNSWQRDGQKLLVIYRHVIYSLTGYCLNAVLYIT